MTNARKFFMLLCIIFMAVSANALYVEIAAGTHYHAHIPTSGYYSYGWSRILYTNSQLSNLAACNITELSYNSYQTPAGFQIENQKIYIAHTSDTAVSDTSYVDPTSLNATLCYDGTVSIDGTGWKTITLSTPFAYNGSDNLYVFWENRDGSGSDTSYCTFLGGPSTSICGALMADDNGFPTDSSFSATFMPDTRFYYEIQGAPGTPSTPNPADLASNVATDATLTWNFGIDTTTYDLYFGAGSLPDTPVISDASATESGSYSPTLSETTTYYWKVVAKNTNTRMVTEGPVWSFSTVVGTVSNFPFVEGFNGTELPVGWNQEVVVASTNSTEGALTFVESGTYPTVTPQEGSAMARYNSFNCAAGTEVRLSTPPLDFSLLTNPVIDFNMIHDAGYPTNDHHDAMFVQVSTDGSNWTTVTDSLLRYQDLEAATWTQHIIDVSSVAGEIAQIGLLFHSGYGNNMYVDNVNIYNFTGTLPPVAASNPSPATGTGAVALDAQLTWDFGANTETYDLYFGADELPATPVVTDATAGDTGSYTPESLSGFTTYYWKVVAKNSSGQRYTTDGPTWSFTTVRTAITDYPVTEGFDNGELPAQWVSEIISSTGWTATALTIEEEGTYPTCTPQAGVGMLKFNSYDCGAGSSARLITPPMNLTGLGAISLNFHMMHNAEYDDCPEYIQIQSSTDDATWTNVGDPIYRYQDLETPEWQRHEVDLSSFADQTVAFAIMFYSEYGSNMYIDTVEFSAVGGANNASITGTVTVGDTALEGVNVALSNGATTTTDANGAYTFGSLYASNYTVSASMPGYADYTSESIAVAEGATVTHDFSMNYALTAPVLSYNITNQSEVNLSWATVVGPVTGYNVYLDGNLIDAVVAPDTTYTHQPDADGDYEYYVSSVWPGDIESVVSNTVTATIAHPAPSSVTFAASETVVGEGTVSWSMFVPGDNFDEDIEDAEIPEGWTTVDNDGDTYNWGVLAPTGGAHNSTNCLYSASYINDLGALTPDNWLITPAINVGSSSTLTYWAKGRDNTIYYAEHYAVMLSTTNTDIASFDTTLFEETIPDSIWIEHQIDLSDYAGQTIYLSWRHYNCTDMYQFCLDDISVSDGTRNVLFAEDFEGLGATPASIACGKNEQPSTRTSRSLTNFKVYLDDQLVDTVGGDATSYTFTNLVEGTNYTYGVTAVYSDDRESEVTEINETFLATDGGVNQLTTKLGSNYPNPFNPTTTIRFSNAQAGHVSVDVYNILGQKVKTLVNQDMTAGEHDITWQGRDDNNRPVSSGIYFYKMKSGRYTSTKKMILMK